MKNKFISCLKCVLDNFRIKFNKKTLLALTANTSAKDLTIETKLANLDNSLQEVYKKVWSDLRYFLAFGFGSGLSPKAPGTFGTVAAIPLYYLICDLNSLLYLLICIFGFIFGVKITTDVSNHLKENDFPGIVWDEIIGFLITMYLVPISTVNTICGFVLFRVFDIWKPQPIKWLDKKFKSGFGIMIDDVMAAIYAWIVLQIIIRII